VKKGWQEKSVGDILQLEYGKPLDESDRKPNGRYPVYGANGEKDRTDKFYHDKPSIIVGRKGSAGEVNLTEKKFWPLDVTYFVTFDEKQHDLQFLYYLLTTLELTKLAKGVKPGINRNEVYSQTTRVPPLAEQQRIVGLLDEAFEGLATAKANAEKNLQNARALFESHLQSVFTQRGPGWLETTLGEVIEIVGGSQPPKSVFSKTKKADNIRLIQIRDYKSDKHVVFIPRDQARRFCNADDVMIGRYGPPLFQILRGIEGAYNVALMKAVPDEAKLSRDFLFYFLKHSAILQYVIYHSSRAAGQIGVTKETLEPYPIALPSLEEQEKVVETIQELETETQRLARLYERKHAALEALKKSLLHQAFTGAL
jgi:type I restriction enzyme S subunit